MTTKPLTSREVAQMFGVGPTTIRRWAESGQLPSFTTLGGHRRFRREDVERLLQGPTEDPCTDDSPPSPSAA